MSDSFLSAVASVAAWPTSMLRLSAAGLVFATTVLLAQEPIVPPSEQGKPVSDRPKVDDVGAFMRMKLAHGQLVLEGLAVEDFDAIARGANALALASQASSWQVLQTEEYARHSGEFRRSCESLRTAARDKNLDGAALAWMEVTMKCIQCHKYVRAADRDRGPPPR